MVNPIDLPVIFAQTPQVQKLQNAGQAFPEAQQSFIGDLVIQKQEKEKDKVPQTEKSDTGIQIKKDKQNKNKQQQNKLRDRKQKKEKKDQKDIEAISSGSGHLINIEI